MTEYTVGANEGLKTLAAAAKVAKSGDTIIVEAGVYSEPLRPPAGTTWIAAPGAVIDGGWNGKKMTGADATAVAVLVNKPDVTCAASRYATWPVRAWPWPRAATGSSWRTAKFTIR